MSIALMALSFVIAALAIDRMIESIVYQDSIGILWWGVFACTFVLIGVGFVFS